MGLSGNDKIETSEDDGLELKIWKGTDFDYEMIVYNDLRIQNLISQQLKISLNALKRKICGKLTLTGKRER